MPAPPWFDTPAVQAAHEDLPKVEAELDSDMLQHSKKYSQIKPYLVTFSVSGGMQS